MISLKTLSEKYMRSNFALLITAIIISIFLWFYIALAQCPTIQKTVYHIPVVTDISGTNASMNGLSVISTDISEVTVEIIGSRTQVKNLNSDTLEAYFNTDYISNSGKKNMPLEIRSVNGVEFKVKSIFPASAAVTFDKLDTREFTLEADIPNVKAVSGKQIELDENACQPSVVRISGPVSQLDKIAKVKAVHSKSETLSSSQILDCDEIQLYTDDNVLVEQTAMKFSDTNIKLIVQVMTQKTVNLAVSISGAPETFNKDNIKLKLSEDSILLACKNSQMEIPDTLTIGNVSLSELKPGFSKTIKLSQCLESSDLINVSDIDFITVELENDDLIQQDLMLNKDRISITNPPDNIYDYEVLTQRLNITIVGPEDVVHQIGPDDISAEVNLLAANANSDQFTWYATFSCPNYDNVWVVSNSRVSIQRTKKSSSSSN